LISGITARGVTASPNMNDRKCLVLEALLRILGAQEPALVPEAPLTDLSREELIAVIREQQRVIEQLREEIERLKGSGYRSAAPFSKGSAKTIPSRRGGSLGKATSDSAKFRSRLRRK